MKITIGMATYNDFEGVWATVQSIFLHNEWESPNDVELIIVDTSPQGSEHRQLVQNFVQKGGHPSQGSRTEHIKYIDMAGTIGTTKPRDVIFEAASAPVVCVMDCHVLLPINALLKLSVWFDKNPECKDLIHGPIVYDNLHMINTHFVDQFRGGMWGTWGNMWRAPNGELVTCEGEEVTDANKPKRVSDGLVHFYQPSNMREVQYSNDFPQEIPWAGHETKLRELGFVEAGRDLDAPPFEIPGMGMGLFACRKDAWLGFAKHCSGFGGEELNIHTKFRQAGHTSICLPFLRWNHRFGRAGGAPYPLTLIAKVRNYVLWANELGLPLDRIHTHFVKGGMLPEGRWRQLIADPINFEIKLTPTTITATKPLDALFQQTAQTAKDLSQHAEFVRGVSAASNSVIAFVKRTDWEPMLAAGFPRTLEIYQSELGPLTEQTHASVAAQDHKDHRKIELYRTHNSGVIDPLGVDNIEPADLLVIDKLMRADYLATVLEKHHSKINKYILLRGTQSFGLKAEFDETAPGLFYAIKDFIASHPEWFVAVHRHEQYGMTLLAKDPLPRPENEVRPWPVGKGPGTELKMILGAVGINPAPNCDCNAKMYQMDEWGIEGCEANFDMICGWLEEKAESWGWYKVLAPKTDTSFSLAEKVAIGWKSISSGLAFKVNPINPYPGLVKEAIKRAKAKDAVL